MLAGGRVPEAGPLIGLAQGLSCLRSTTLLRLDEGKGLAVRHGTGERAHGAVVRNAWLRGGRPQQTVLCCAPVPGSKGPLTTRLACAVSRKELSAWVGCGRPAWDRTLMLLYLVIG